MECHREGVSRTFGLEHYDEAEENAGMIRKVVSEGIMPPWFASDPPAGHPSPWANDRSLSPSDKADLLAWIKKRKPKEKPGGRPLPESAKANGRSARPTQSFPSPGKSRSPHGKCPHATCG